MDQRMIIAILASGEGSNADALVRESRRCYPHLEIDVIITDNPSAGVISRAATLKVPCFVVPWLRSEGQSSAEAKADHEQRLLALLKERGIELVLLAGYQRLLSANFLQQFWDPRLEAARVINIHPSLLPQFPGKDAYRQAFAAEVPRSGITIHFVDAGVDTGRIIAQEEFPRLEGDDFSAFQQRGLALEHRLYPRVVGTYFG